MAITKVSANNVITKWRTDVWREFRRGNLFSPYMGESPTSIIQVMRDLRDGGDVMNIPIVGALRGPGVSTGPLTGNEEKLDNYGLRVWVDWARNAVLLTRAQMRKTANDQLDIVRPLLTEWGNTLLRDEIVLTMGSIPSESPPANWGNEATAGMRVNGIIYDQASAAQKNTWSDANSDRVVYGALRSNLSAGNHAASLANVDATNDKLTAANLLLMKRMAKRSSPQISPYRDNEDQGREWYVAFAGSNTFRDLAADATIVSANTNARAREGNGIDRNPLFQDGDLMYRGIIIREIPEIDDFLTISGAGAGSIDVAPVFLCGQNALAIAWGQMPRPTERKEDDYGFLIGRGVEMVYGIAKVFKKRDPDAASSTLVQWGMVTGFFASTPDA